MDKPKIVQHFSRPCTYLKNDAINQSKKIGGVAQSLYLGAAGLSVYYLNNYYYRSTQMMKPNQIQQVSIQESTEDTLPSFNDAELFGSQEILKEIKKPTFAEDDESMSWILKDFIDEKSNTLSYGEFRAEVRKRKKTLSQNQQAQKLIDICERIDENAALNNPGDLIDSLNKITFLELPPEMSRVACEKRAKIIGSSYWPHIIISKGLTYRAEMIKKLSREKPSDLD